MKYQATFGIDCGVSPGLSIKCSDYVKRDETLVADNEADALIAVAKLAVNFSKDYLSNPENNLTTVTLLALYDSNRNLINQKDALKKKGFDSIQRFEWDEHKLVTKCSMIEHLLLTASEKV